MELKVGDKIWVLKLKVSARIIDVCGRAIEARLNDGKGTTVFLRDRPINKEFEFIK